MKAVLIVMVLVATASAQTTCPQFEALRCKRNVIELCTDDEGRATWTHYETCKLPERCVEDEPNRAECSAESRTRRKVTRAAALAIGFVWVVTGGVRRLSE